MSLRTGAGAGRALGPVARAGAGLDRPASTWPTRVNPIAPNSIGGHLLGLSSAYRPLSDRDRAQLRGARELPPSQTATVGVMIPLAHGTAARSFRPMPVDRGFRVPYNIPNIPGGTGSSSDDGGSSSSSGGGGGCCG